jgi:quercetin dioxygenase-like cupin family protein
MFKTTRRIGSVLLLACGAMFAQQAPAHGLAAEPIVRPRVAKELADIPGKEALVLTVEYPPGGADPVHRHDAHGFIYVLEGQVVMAVKGGTELTLGPGDTFYEGPGDVHTVGRNASKTRRARFLVMLVKNAGADALVPVH